VNRQKLVAFLYINNEHSEEEISKTIMFTVASKFKISSNKLNGGIKKTYATKTINH
jgi:hypothetical protein